MSLNARCQVCGVTTFEWSVRQITIDVRTLRNYKLQACPRCQEAIEVALVKTFRALKEKEPADV